MSRALIVIALAFILFGVKAYRDMRALESSHEIVAAKVTRVEPGYAWMRTPQAARISFEFTLKDGVKRLVRSGVSQGLKGLSAGDELRLAVDPANPSRFLPESSLHRPKHLAMTLIIAGLAIFALSFYLR